MTSEQSTVVECPWCRGNVPLMSGKFVLRHSPWRPHYVCAMAGETPERARELTDEEIAHHVVTGE